MHSQQAFVASRTLQLRTSWKLGTRPTSDRHNSQPVTLSSSARHLAVCTEKESQPPARKEVLVPPAISEAISQDAWPRLISDRRDNGTKTKQLQSKTGGHRTAKPWSYDPATSAALFTQRPFVILTRLLQVLSAAAVYAAFRVKQAGNGTAGATAWARSTPPSPSSTSTKTIFKSQPISSHSSTGSSSSLTDTDTATTTTSSSSGSALDEEQRLLCKLLTELGPVYVKLGQTLSARPDIVGVQTATALKKLQVCAAVGTYTEVSSSTCMILNQGGS